MQTLEAVQKIIVSSGQSVRAVSLALGRSENFLATTIYKGSTPRANTLAEIASACGYSLALIPQGEQLPDSAIVIDSN